MSSTVAPTAPSERYGVLDALRGFALLGVLMANLPFHRYGPAFTQTPPVDFPSDGRVDQFIGAIFVGKSLPLLSMLFGLGFILMYDKLRASGKGWAGPYYRRCIGLMILGVLHSVFLFDGDILYTYGAIGMALPLFAKAGRTAILTTMAVFALIGVAIGSINGFVADSPRSDFFGSESVGLSFADALMSRIAKMLQLLLLAPLSAWGLFALMLLGVYAARAGWIGNGAYAERIRQRMRLVSAPIALLIGLPSGWIYNDHADQYSRVIDVLGATGYVITWPLAALGIFGWMYKLLSSNNLTSLRQLLSAVGRLSLTNYLTQSIVLAVLFASWGFDLARNTTLLEAIGIAALLYAISALASFAWLQRFRIGPWEFILRAFTYWKVPQLTKS